jgi:hypothetical protein
MHRKVSFSYSLLIDRLVERSLVHGFNSRKRILFIKPRNSLVHTVMEAVLIVRISRAVVRLEHYILSASPDWLRVIQGSSLLVSWHLLPINHPSDVEVGDTGVVFNVEIAYFDRSLRRSGVD